jgi:cytochrome P450
MLTGWETHARRGEAIDIDEEMMRLALEIVGKALFSIDLSREAQKLTQAVLTALDHIVYKASHFLALPDSFPTPRNRRFRAALATLDAAVAELIESRRGMSSPPDDLLSMLLFARNEDGSPAMTARQVRDEVLTILIAGHETVASALTWAWHLLSLHPEAARRLRQEACAVLGDGAPAPAHLEQLVYTRQVFEETLRLYPPG